MSQSQRYRCGESLLLLIALVLASPAYSQETPPAPGPVAAPAPSPLTVPAPASPRAPGASAQAQAAAAPGGLPLKIKQVNVIDRASPSRRPCVPLEPAGTVFGAVQNPALVVPATLQVLKGAGDIEVTVGQDTYLVERAQTNKHAKPSHLFVNGVNMGDDAKLVAQLSCGPDVHLRYRIEPGENSQKLWAALYRSSGLTKEEPLNVAIGWDETGPSSEQASQIGPREIAVTSSWSEYLALLAVVTLGTISGLIFFFTDAFRDLPSPWWSKDAKRLVALRRKANLGADDAWLKQMYGAKYDQTRVAEYDAAAARASVGNLPKSELEEWDTLFGLLRTRKVPRRIYGTFSLARTQLGMWFYFSVASGVFLWIVYGRLPKIDNSLLLLLGLSIGTAGISLAIDKSNSDASQPFTSSRGLLNDLVIGGKDDKEQVYRYQAVVVNLLLLFVGITHVVQNLSYPLFDPTWLAFLGISGAALTVGKQISETPKVPPA